MALLEPAQVMRFDRCMSWCASAAQQRTCRPLAQVGRIGRSRCSWISLNSSITAPCASCALSYWSNQMPWESKQGRGSSRQGLPAPSGGYPWSRHSRGNSLCDSLPGTNSMGDDLACPHRPRPYCRHDPPTRRPASRRIHDLSRLRDDVTAVRTLDLARYAGTWREIAAIPQFFRRKCASVMAAAYATLPDGMVSVNNTCVRKKASASPPKAGRASWTPRCRRNSRCVPALPRRVAVLVRRGLLGVRGLDPGYRWAVVGHPQRTYAWVLSRGPRLRLPISPRSSRCCARRATMPATCSRRRRTAAGRNGSLFAAMAPVEPRVAGSRGDWKSRWRFRQPQACRDGRGPGNRRGANTRHPLQFPPASPGAVERNRQRDSCLVASWRGTTFTVGNENRAHGKATSSDPLGTTPANHRCRVAVVNPSRSNCADRGGCISGRDAWLAPSQFPGPTRVGTLAVAGMESTSFRPSPAFRIRDYGASARVFSPQRPASKSGPTILSMNRAR